MGFSSILGMNLFGCKFCDDKTKEGKCPSDDDVDKDRKNFDSLLWAIVTVFQVPNKNKIIYNQKQKKRKKKFF